MRILLTIFIAVVALIHLAKCTQNQQYKLQRSESKPSLNVDQVKYRNFLYNIARSIPRIGRRASASDFEYESDPVGKVSYSLLI